MGKKAENVIAMLEPLVTKKAVSLAVTNAEQCRKHHLNAGTSLPANPSTDVDRLIKAINEAVSPANKFL